MVIDPLAVKIQMKCKHCGAEAEYLLASLKTKQDLCVTCSDKEIQQIIIDNCQLPEEFFKEKQV